MIWPFRRSKPEAIANFSTTTSWRPGDVAECIKGQGRVWKGHGRQGYEPKVGDKAMVTKVFIGCMPEGEHTYGLALAGFPDWDGFPARCFRKVVLTDVGADRKISLACPARESVDA